MYYGVRRSSRPKFGHPKAQVSVRERRLRSGEVYFLVTVHPQPRDGLDIVYK